MRSLQIMAPGRAEVVELPIPEVGQGEVRVRVIACNTCPQWDLHLAAGEPMFVGQALPYPYTPGQPGHEMVGEVDAVGGSVSDFTPGQRVAAWRDQGHQRPGCYAEYVCFDADNLLPVPADLPPEAVASLELAMCVAASILALRDMGLMAGRAAVNGLGPAGLIAAQLLRAEGAGEVVALEPSQARRELAVGLGLVDAAWDPRAAETAAALAPRRRQAAPFDLAVDCVGFPEAVRFLMDRTGRAVAFFAVQRHDYAYAPLHAGLHLVGYPGHSKSAAVYALERIVAGDLDLRPLVTCRLPLSRYAEGVDLLRRQEAIKIAYVPTEWDG